MYRCFACDAPAMMNCGCHTQLERPDDDAVVEQFAAEEGKAIASARRHIPDRSINIASGEDVYYHEEHT